MNTSGLKSVRREWWQDLERIIIVAVPSVKDLPDQERDAARRRIEKTKLPNLLKSGILHAADLKNPQTCMLPFVVDATDEQIAEWQNQMVEELGVRGPAVWAAYRGAPADGDRIWVVGVPRAEGGLSALYAHIRAEAEFKTKNAAMDATEHRSIPLSQPTKSSMSDVSEAAATVRDSARSATEVLSSNSQHEPLGKWEDLKISFLSEERIQIQTPSKIRTFNYTEFGLNDRRNGKPNMAWIALRSLAENQGILKQPPNGQKWANVEKQMQKIRVHLRERFSLQDDPLPFVSDVGYRAKFTIDCSASYGT